MQMSESLSPRVASKSSPLSPAGAVSVRMTSYSKIDADVLRANSRDGRLSCQLFGADEGGGKSVVMLHKVGFSVVFRLRLPKRQEL